MAEDRGGRGIGLADEPAVGLLGGQAGARAVARAEKRVDGPHGQPRHVDPGRGGGTGLGPGQLDDPLPVRRGLGVAEHPLGRLGRGHPGREFLGRAARGLPVPGHLRGQRRVAGQRPRRALVQYRPLPGQQPGGHRLGQQRVPGPVPPAGGVLGEQPGRRQLPQPPPHRLHLQPGDHRQHILTQAPARDRQTRQHRPRLRGAAARPHRQQLRQPGRESRRDPQATLVCFRQRRGYQLLGEERVPLRPRVQLIDHPRRRRTVRQGRDLPGHLRPRQRPQPDLRHPRVRPHPREPARHMLRQRRLIPAAGHHHPHRPRAPRPGQERQEIQRLAVRPVHILHHQPHPGPRPPGHHGQHLRHGGEQPLSAPLPVPATRDRPATRTQPRQQPAHFFAHIPRRGIQRRRQKPAALGPGQLTQRISHRQQRQRARQQQALPPQHHHPRRRGPGCPLSHEPGLAHPGIPHHQHQPRLAAQRPQQPGQLTLTADEAHRASHAPSPPAQAPPVNPSPRGSPAGL